MELHFSQTCDAANLIPDTVDWANIAFAKEDLLPPVIEPARITPMHSLRFGRKRRLVDAEPDLRIADLPSSPVQEAMSPPSRIEHAKVQAVKEHLRLFPDSSVPEACKAVDVSTRS